MGKSGQEDRENEGVSGRAKGHFALQWIEVFQQLEVKSLSTVDICCQGCPHRNKTRFVYRDFRQESENSGEPHSKSECDSFASHKPVMF